MTSAAATMPASVGPVGTWWARSTPQSRAAGSTRRRRPRPLPGAWWPRSRSPARAASRRWRPRGGTRHIDRRPRRAGRCGRGHGGVRQRTPRPVGRHRPAGPAAGRRSRRGRHRRSGARPRGPGVATVERPPGRRPARSARAGAGPGRRGWRRRGSGLPPGPSARRRRSWPCAACVPPGPASPPPGGPARARSRCPSVGGIRSGAGWATARGRGRGARCPGRAAGWDRTFQWSSQAESRIDPSERPSGFAPVRGPVGGARPALGTDRDTAVRSR